MTLRNTSGYGVALLLFIAAIGIFYIFTYNSGYGYDALEYLVIGRSLLDGYHFYDFIPSKSWGLYTLVAAFLTPGNTANHIGVSAFITAAFGIALAGVYFLARRRYDRVTAYIAAGLTALSAVFMEMNYLEPEIFVFLAGLAAFVCLSPARGTVTGKSWFAAGVAVGIGFAFKSVAAFYVPALLLFAIFRGQIRKESALRIAGNISSLILGFLSALLAPALYFALTGRLSQHLEWTYLFPLLQRPAGTFWMYKLSTKLLWFFALLLIAVALSLTPRKRREIYLNENTMLALLMGAFSLSALLKQQASHYVFPAAGFLSIYMAAVFDACRPKKQVFTPVLITIAILLAVMLPASVMLYNPRAIHRIARLADYAREKELADYIQRQTGEDDLALFFKKGTFLYWISHRYPAVPFVKLHVQETWLLKKQPELLSDALDNPRLTLVEFDPDQPGIQDRAFFEQSGSIALISEFNRKLVIEFKPVGERIPPWFFWHRRDRDL